MGNELPRHLDEIQHIYAKIPALQGPSLLPRRAGVLTVIIIAFIKSSLPLIHLGSQAI